MLEESRPGGELVWLWFPGHDLILINLIKSLCSDMRVGGKVLDLVSVHPKGSKEAIVLEMALLEVAKVCP